MELRWLRQNPAVVIAVILVVTIAAFGYFFNGGTYNGFWGAFFVVIELVVMVPVFYFVTLLGISLFIGVPIGVFLFVLAKISRFFFGGSFAQNLTRKADKWLQLGLIGLAAIFWLFYGISGAYEFTEEHHLGQDGRQCFDSIKLIAQKFTTRPDKPADAEAVTAALNACTRYLDSGKGSGSMRAKMYGRRGDLAEINKDFDLALADFKHAGRLSPQDTYPWNSLVQILRTKGDCDGLIDAYTQLIRIEPNEGTNFIGRGAGYECKHDYDHAIANFDEAIRLRPDDARGYLGRASARKAKGQTELAQANLLPLCA